MSSFGRLTIKSVDGVSIAAKHWHSRNSSPETSVIIIFVHQWGILGGCGKLMEGMAKEMGDKGYLSITFDLRGVGGSSGSSTCYNQEELKDVTSVIDYVVDNFPDHDIFLVGSSAGAPTTGAVLDYSPKIIGGCFIGYVWGYLGSFIFGWSYQAIADSSKPKLFICSDCDQYTSIAQYQSRLAGLKGSVNEMIVIPGKDHFQIEQPPCDEPITNWIHEFVVEKFRRRLSSSSSVGSEHIHHSSR